VVSHCSSILGEIEFLDGAGESKADPFADAANIVVSVRARE